MSETSYSWTLCKQPPALRQIKIKQKCDYDAELDGAAKQYNAQKKVIGGRKQTNMFSKRKRSSGVISSRNFERKADLEKFKKERNIHDYLNQTVATKNQVVNQQKSHKKLLTGSHDDVSNSHKTTTINTDQDMGYVVINHANSNGLEKFYNSTKLQDATVFFNVITSHGRSNIRHEYDLNDNGNKAFTDKIDSFVFSIKDASSSYLNFLISFKNFRNEKIRCPNEVPLEWYDPLDIFMKMVRELMANSAVLFTYNLQLIVRMFYQSISDEQNFSKADFNYIFRNCFDIKTAAYLLKKMDIRTNSFSLFTIIENYAKSSYSTWKRSKERSNQGLDILNNHMTDPYVLLQKDVMSVLSTDVCWNLVHQISRSNMYELLWGVEIPTSVLLGKLETTGIYLNVVQLKRDEHLLKSHLNHIEKLCHIAAGEGFNLKSSQQISAILFKKLSLEPPPNTKLINVHKNGIHKTTQKHGTWYSTNNAVLEQLRNKHKIVELILRHRKLTKLLTSYVAPLLRVYAADHTNGVIYPNWNQHSTETGRISASKPSFQNFPRKQVLIDRETTINIRKSIICRTPSSIYVSFDYSQFEMRILASYVGKHSALYALFDQKTKTDVYCLCASSVFRKHYDDITSHDRNLMKSIVLGIIYCQGPKSISESLSITEEKAKEFLASFFSNYKATYNFIAKVKEIAMSKGYVEDIYGRKRWLNESKSTIYARRKAAERKAVNSLIQGTSSTLLKLAMLKCK